MLQGESAIPAVVLHDHLVNPGENLLPTNGISAVQINAPLTEFCLLLETNINTEIIYWK